MKQTGRKIQFVDLHTGKDSVFNIVAFEDQDWDLLNSPRINCNKAKYLVKSILLDFKSIDQYMKRKPHFITLGCADIGLVKENREYAPYSQAKTERGYFMRAIDVLDDSKSSLEFIHPDEKVIGIQNLGRINYENINPIGLPQWKELELKETKGSLSLGIVAIFTNITLGITEDLLIILVGFPDGVSDDIGVIEVTNRNRTSNFVVKRGIQEAKETQANIYAALLGVKKWRCVFYCRDKRFTTEGETDYSKALKDISEAVKLQLQFYKKSNLLLSMSKDEIWGQSSYKYIENAFNEYGEDFANSFKDLSELRIFGFSLSNIVKIYEMGAKSAKDVNITLLKKTVPNIQNGLSKVIFEQALCKWAISNGETYVNRNLLNQILRENFIFYDIEFIDKDPILYGFLNKGEIIQFDDSQRNKVLDFVKSKLTEGAIFAAYGNTDKNFINNLFSENEQEEEKNFVSNEVDVSRIILRGLSLRTNTKKLYDVAGALSPKLFNEISPKQIDIVSLVEEYRLAANDSRKQKEILNEIKKKNRYDLLLLEVVYNSLRDKYGH